MTRRAELDSKLKAALHELKSTRDTCNRLLEEREIAERDIIELIERNTSLKTELAAMTKQSDQIVLERDQLQVVVDSQDQCRDTYETTLQRVILLEHQLASANLEISCLQKKNMLLEHNNTLNLYDEIMEINNKNVSAFKSQSNIPATPCSNSNKNCINGSNKIKKYVKLNKFIKKSENIVKKQKTNLKSLPLIKQKVSLSIELENCQKIINEQSLEISSLVDDMKTLQASLNSMTCKYTSSQKEIKEYSLALDELISMSTYNLERFDSLTNKHNSDSNVCEPSVVEPTSLPPQQSPVSPVVSCVSEVRQVGGSPVTAVTTDRQTQRTFILSDEMGRGFGSMLTHLTNQKVVNYCQPGASLDSLLASIKTEVLDKHCTIIIALGNSYNISKNNFIGCFKQIVELGVGRVIFCALPYTGKINSEFNKNIYNLNMYIYNMSCHTGSIHFIDTNKFISNCIMTGGTLHLQYSHRLSIAKLLAYNLHFKTYTNTVISICTNDLKN